jgi:hypothetical protein
MADDTITLVSTSDTPDQVLEALTGKAPEATPPPATPPAAETPPEEKPSETPPPAEDKAPEAEPETAETPEQKTDREAREASEAGSRLAKRRVSIQSEIDELTRNKYNVRRDVEAEEARLSELRRERERLEGEVAKPATAKPEGKGEPPPAADERPEPKVDAVDDKGTAKYATYEEYLSDHAKWTREQAEAGAKRVIAEQQKADRERIERDSASRAVNERVAKYQHNLDEFKKTHADFDAVYEDAKEAAQAIRIALGPDAFTTIDGYTVFDAEDAPGLTYYLLKNPDEVKAIAMKAPPHQVIHLARLEERLRQEGAKAPGPSSHAAPVKTKAPEPIKPVGSSPTASTVSPDEESYQDFKARRERELRARAGR